MTVFSFSQMQKWSDIRWVATLVLITLIMILPGFFALPPVDRDETRFAQSTRQMVASNDYIDIPFQDGKRYKKPIGIYWLQAASVKAVGVLTGATENAPIWVYRLPSLFGIVASVLATFWLARAFLTPYGAGIAGLMLAVSVLPGYEARIAKTDAFLLFVVLLAQAVLARGWMGGDAPLSRGMRLVFWLALAAGVLIKGPIVLLVTGLTLALLLIVDRSFALIRQLKPLSGVLILLVVTLPWFVAIGLKSDGAFFAEAGLRDFLGKVVAVKESHGGPPGIYAALMTLTFWPASVFFIAAVPFILRNWNARPVLFALVWAVPSWLIFELTPTKLPHYVLPLYPALALGVGFAFQNVWTVRHLWQKIVLSLLFVLPGLLGTVALSGLIYLEGSFAPLVLVSAIGAVAAGYFAWRGFVAGTREPGRAVMLMALSAGLIYLATYQFAFPALRSLWVSNGLVAMLEKHPPVNGCPAPSVISLGYTEPSLAFLGPLDLRFETPDSAAAKLSEAPCRLIFLSDPAVPLLKERLQGTKIDLLPLETLNGMTLNGGKKVTIGLYAVREAGS